MKKMGMQMAILFGAMLVSAIAGYQFHIYQQKNALQAHSEQVTADMQSFFDKTPEPQTDKKPT